MKKKQRNDEQKIQEGSYPWIGAGKGRRVLLGKHPQGLKKF